VNEFDKDLTVPVLKAATTLVQVNGRSSFRVENILMSEQPVGKFLWTTG